MLAEIQINLVSNILISQYIFPFTLCFWFEVGLGALETHSYPENENMFNVLKVRIVHKLREMLEHKEFYLSLNQQCMLWRIV